MDSFRSKLALAGAVASTALVSGSAFAQTALDVSSATDGLAQVGVAVAAIGVAMVAVSRLASRTAGWSPYLAK